MNPAAEPIKVLVVDDSAVMRGIMSRIIESQPDMKVAAVASDPVVAIERLRSVQPDVITLDVEMPRMDGLAFLAKLMHWRPLPVVMVSSLTARGAETTLRALELGAVDFMTKPELGAGASLDAYAEQVVEKLRAAAAARVTRRVTASAPSAPIPESIRPIARSPAASATERNSTSTDGRWRLTGGSAERRVSSPPPLRASMRCIPPGAMYACPPCSGSPSSPSLTRISQLASSRCAKLRVKPAGMCCAMTIGGMFDGSGASTARSASTPPVEAPMAMTRSKASGVAGRARRRGCGADAMLELRQRGARNLAQDEASCVVFGMPKQAIARGGVHEVLPLDAIARRLVELSLANG